VRRIGYEGYEVKGDEVTERQEFLGWNESVGTTLRMKLRLSGD
jgi:hypothetical protein